MRVAANRHTVRVLVQRGFSRDQGVELSGFGTTERHDNQHTNLTRFLPAGTPKVLDITTYARVEEQTQSLRNWRRFSIRESEG